MLTRELQGSFSDCLGGGDIEVSEPSTGVYCLDFIYEAQAGSNKFQGGSVTADGDATGFPIAYITDGAHRGCPAGTEETVTTYRQTVTGGLVTGTLTNEAWHGVFS